MEYIQRKAQSASGQQAADVLELGNLYEKKLWHQLSVKLEDLLRSTQLFVGAAAALELYNDFVTLFENKISSIKLVKIVSLIGDSIQDGQQALALYNSLLNSTKTKLETEAQLSLEMEIVMMKLLIMGSGSSSSTETEREKERDSIAVVLDQYESTVNTLKSSEPLVFSKFYQAKSMYKKIYGPANEFYSSALMYLAYTPINEIPTQEAVRLAIDMALAAITSTKIYNFGEVLATPILDALTNTNEAWLKQLVELLNQGAVPQVEQLLTQHREAFVTVNSPLAHNLPIVLQKAQLLSVVNLAFERSPHDRIIKFDEIAQRSFVAHEQVEWLLMKAMSVNLIKGVIDEVSQEVSITWIQPRVLNKEQLGGVRDQITTWTEKVKTAVLSIEDQTAELFA